MKHIKKMIAAMLATLLVICALPCSALAATENTPKEEVVYINLNTDGSVKEIVVVNIFDLDAEGQIIDYGKYESLQNMTTTDKIHYENDIVTIGTGAGRLYYEGKLSSNVMPWNISLRYFLDGKEYSGSEIAGKSGNLRISMEITENPNHTGNFFEGYALQASLTLDTSKCRNITAEGATVANVGGNKQLTYTILPNKGSEVEITAQVTDFEMDPIAINGVKLNLSIEIDDSKLKEKIDEITNAVGEVDNGAEDLNDGAKELYDGTTKLKEKGSELQNGVAALSKGTSELASGLDTLTTNNQSLVNGAYAGFRGLCITSETILNARLSEYGLKTVSLTPETYSQVLGDLLSMFGYKEASTQSEVQTASILDEAIASLVELKTNLDNYKAFYNGIVSYTSGVSDAASGANTLKTNMNTLNTNVGTLNNAFQELNDGAKELYDGTSSLKEGTNEFANETDDIEAKVSEEIDSMIATATGSEIEVESFVSQNNTNVNSVQFVIRTEAITVAEEVQTQEVAQENLNFWQKLLRLFNL